jgi:hypothetical protein
MSDADVFFNGINGVTGNYIADPISFSQLTQEIKLETIDEDYIRRMDRTAANFNLRAFGLPFGTEPSDVTQAGWAIVFHTEESDAVKNALAPLIEHRREQIGEQKTKILDYRPNEQWPDWLERHGVTPGDVEPTKVPFYVLIVGDPIRIPYEFNYLLDVDYAVGRLSFDTPEEYRRYVESVLEYETNSSVPNDKTAVIFGTEHNVFPPDNATLLSSEQLVRPLAGVPGREGGEAPMSILDRVGFRKRSFIADQATKANLSEVFRSSEGTNPPAILFTATHGIEFFKGDPEQLAAQGALLCQDWAGPGQMSNKFYYTAADLPDDSRVHGMITFHFACYGAGTPRRDSFPRKPGQELPEIADRPFIAMLPKRLLTHPQGGALAVIGHIERAWGASITGITQKQQVQPFENTLGYLCLGRPVGYAVKDFNERTASLSVFLSQMIENLRYGQEVSAEELASIWLARNDSRNYVIIGDPAVRLRVEKMT